MVKEFKTLAGMRVMLSVPTKEESKIKLLPEEQERIDREFFTQIEKLEIYAVGENVEGYNKGDIVYVPTEELKRGILMEIDGERKIIINSLAIALVW